MANTAATVEVRGKSNVGDVVGKDISKAEQALKGIQNIAKFSFAGASLAGVIGFTAEMVQLGAQVNRTTAALNALSGSQADAYIAAIKEETHGLVSEAAAAGIATNLLGLKIVSTADEAAEFTRIAATLGGTFRGLGAEQAAQEMSLLFSNMSLLRLDTFGISAAKVKARIQELQEATPGLTREIAFQQAAMEEARVAADQLSGSLDDQAASIERFKVLVQDSKADLGVLVAEGFDPAITAIWQVKEAMDAANQSTLGLGNDGLTTLSIIAAVTQGNIGALATWLTSAENAAKEANREAAAGAGHWGEYGKGVEEAQEPVRQITYDLEKQAEVVKAAQVAQQHLVDIQQGSLGTVTSLTEGWHSWSEIGQQLIGDLGGLKIPAGELLGIQREIALQTGLATQDQLAQADAISAAKQAFEQGKLSAQGLLDVYLAIPAGVQAANDALSRGLQQQDKNLTFASESKDYYAAPESALDPLQQFQQSLQDTQGTMTTLGDTAETEFSRVDASMDVSMGKAQFLKEELAGIGDILAGYSNVNFYGHVGVTLPGMQHGGEFVVGGPAGTDRVPISFMATRGETVRVTPAGQESTGHTFNLGTVNIYPQGPTGVSDALEELGIRTAGL